MSASNEEACISLRRNDPAGGFRPSPVNILVVDDLPEKLLVYKTILEELDQNLYMVNSGEEALKLVLKHEFAVILLDVNMPGMDGFETAAMIRNRKRSARTPIIFLTAFNDDMNAAQGYASGAVDYLPTPVVPEILKAKVRVFIELSQMREQAAIQAEERARRNSAEEADRRKDEFLGMLAHELRNPLGPILNGVHLLQMMVPKEPRLESLRSMIERQVGHMVRMVDDLLDTTRLARGLILLRKERCDLVEIVRNVTGDHRNIFEAQGLKLNVNVPDTPLWMEGDSTRLTQIIGNLLHNAQKFTPAGGAVSVKLEAEGKDHARITVRDTGIGIDPQMIGQIFDVFRQAEQGLDRTKGGLGLGLALVKGLVELHNGEVKAYSDGIGKGSVFEISLPLGARISTAAPQADGAANAALEKARVVVIEDNRDTTETLQMLLTSQGYDVRVAHTGVEGLEVAHTFKPQIVLCDIGLPAMDGYQVANAIRRDPDPEVSSCYMIALSGYGRDADQARSRESGFDLHLTKPVDYQHLCRVFSRLPVRTNA
jgi:signal transduction histidine kinase